MSKYSALLEPDTTEIKTSKYASLLEDVPVEKEVAAPESSLIGKIKDRFNKAGEFTDKFNSTQMYPLAYGGAAAGSINDVISTGLGKIIPESVKAFAKEQLIDNPNSPVNAALKLASPVMQKYGEFAKKNPDKAYGIDQLANIASLVPIGKGATVTKDMGVGVASRGLGTIENLAKNLKDPVANVSSHFSGVKKASLEAATDPLLSNMMVENSGKQFNLAQDLKNQIHGENYFEAIKKNNEPIKKALEIVKPIDINPAIEALKSGKKELVGGRISPEAEAANNVIDDLINRYRANDHEVIKPFETIAEKKYKAPKLDNASIEADAKERFQKELEEQARLDAVYDMAKNNGRKSAIAKYTDNAIGNKTGKNVDILAKDLSQDEIFKSSGLFEEGGSLDPNDFISMLDEAVGRKTSKTEFRLPEAKKLHKEALINDNLSGEKEYNAYLKKLKEDEAISHGLMLDNINKFGEYPLNKDMSIVRGANPDKPYNIAGIDIPEDLAVLLSNQARSSGGELSIEDISTALNDHLTPSGEMGKKTRYLNGNDYLTLRQEIDNSINWKDMGDKSRSIVEDALKKMRTQMRSDLLKSSDEIYAKNMLELANKLDARDDVVKYVRDIDRHGESFIDNLFGKNKTDAQNVIKELDAAYGTDYYNKAKAAFLGKQFGENAGGAATYLNQTPTGKNTQIGTLLGGLTGAMGLTAMGHPTAAIGTLATGVGGAVLQSPKMGVNILKGLNRVEKGAGNIRKFINPSLGSIKVDQLDIGRSNITKINPDIAKIRMRR